MLLNGGVGEDSWESLRLQGDPTSPFWRRSALGFLWREWCWSWNSSTLDTSCEELTHWKRLWCWEGLGAGEEGNDRGWDGWMASLTRWTWIWVNSGSWWWTRRPGVLGFMGLQRVGHDWVTELNWKVMVLAGGAFGRWLGHESRALPVGLAIWSSLEKAPLPFLPCEVYSRLSVDTESASSMILDFTTFSTVRNKCLLILANQFTVFLWQQPWSTKIGANYWVPTKIKELYKSIQLRFQNISMRQSILSILYMRKLLSRKVQ